MGEPMPLPARLDTANAAALYESISRQRGSSIELDGSGVSRAGALGLQVLISAHRCWQEDGLEFSVTKASEPLKSACQTLGIDAGDIGLTTEEED